MLEIWGGKMKTYLRIIALFVVVGLIVLVFTLFRQATAPESAIIAKERSRVAATEDKSRMGKDPVYAVEIRSKLRFLDYRVAVAYNKENKPDDAINLLQQLISSEETVGKGGIPRRSRSYRDEARYYEALQQAYVLKHDEAGAERANQRRLDAIARAIETGRKERSEEGKSVGILGE